MTLSGSGVDKNFGGPPTPTQRELETTAWAEINKAATGIVRDTIAQIFTDLNPRYTFGYLGGFGYRSASSRPLLDHNLETVRLTQAVVAAAVSIAWQAIYDDLVLQLPADLQQRFTVQMGFPPEERNFIFVVLDNILMMTAKTLSDLEGLSRPVDAGSLQAARTVYNLLLPFAVLNNALLIGSELGENIQNIVEELGPNYPDFDAFTNVLTQMHGTLGIFNKIIQNLNNIQPGDNLSDEDRARAAQAAEQFTQMADQLQVASQNGQFQLLDSSLRALAAIASALSLPYTGSATLYMGLNTATLGIDTSQSATGFIGPSFSTAIDTLTDGITSNAMPNVNAAGQNFIQMLVTIGFIAAIGMASQAADNGLGPLPGSGQAAHSFSWIDPITLGMLSGVAPGTAAMGDWLPGLIAVAGAALCIGMNLLQDESGEEDIPRADPADLQMARFMQFSSALHLVMKSNIIQEFFNEAVIISGGNAKAQAQLTPILSQLTNVLIALAGTGNDKRYSPFKVLEEEASHLEGGINAALELAAGEEGSENAKAAAVTISQLQKALQDNNYEAFLDSFNTVLESLGVSESAMLDDINTIRQAIATMIKSANDKDDEHTRIGIVNIV